MNERHYGALTGLNKDEKTARYGAAQVLQWRRSYDCPPPALVFFQAEDVIRDDLVTGVQTCALPIWLRHRARDPRDSGLRSAGRRSAGYDEPRSEERRVGKECRSRWSPYH